MQHGAIDIAAIHFLAVQRGVSRDRSADNNRQFCFVRIIDNFQVRFVSRRAQQGFCQVCTGLPEARINYQQRFHYVSPAVS